MIQTPMDVLRLYPIRKTKHQKEVFRKSVIGYAQQLGYSAQEESGSFGCRNLLFGDPEKATYLVTAHYDTCAAMPFPNFITPCSLVLFWAYQLLLTGLILGVAFLLGGALAFLTGLEKFGFVFGYCMVWVLLLIMLIGPANKSNANDNTSGVIAVLEIMRSIPQNSRDRVCFVLFDLEEAGLIGSSYYRKKHKSATNRQVVINLDCVGEGDHIRFFPTKKLKSDKKKLTSLYRACGYFGTKSVVVCEKGFAFYPSDQANFPYGVGVCALKKSKFGLYLGKIHTSRDVVLDETNINILRAGLISYITCSAVEKKG